MWKLLLDKLVLGVDLNLTIVLSVSVLLFLDVSTVSLDVCDLSVFPTVPILFFDMIGYVLASLTTFYLISLPCQMRQY